MNIYILLIFNINYIIIYAALRHCISYYQNKKYSKYLPTNLNVSKQKKIALQFTKLQMTREESDKR